MADHSEIDFNKLARYELLELKMDIEAEIDKIKMQIGHAKGQAATTGEYADPEWYRNAEYALRIKGRQCQRIQFLSGKLKKEERDTLEKAFMDVSKEELEADDFHQILSEAKRRVE